MPAAARPPPSLPYSAAPRQGSTPPPTRVTPRGCAQHPETPQAGRARAALPSPSPGPGRAGGCRGVPGGGRAHPPAGPQRLPRPSHREGPRPAPRRRRPPPFPPPPPPPSSLLLLPPPPRSRRRAGGHGARRAALSAAAAAAAALRALPLPFVRGADGGRAGQRPRGAQRGGGSAPLPQPGGGHRHDPLLL